MSRGIGWLATSFSKSISKALAVMRHPARPKMWSNLLRRTSFDYRREVGDCLDASVVTAPVQWLQRSLPEARLAIRKRQRAGKVTDMVDHPMLQLVANPNAHYGDIALWFGTILSYCIDGNAYWMKVRNRGGRPVELWYVPHWMMEPVAPIDGSDLLSHYRYSPGGVEPIIIDPADVVHFRHGINPHNMMKGLSPIDGVIREIFMDLEASNFVASLLRNMGVPGVVISPQGGAMPAPEDVEATKVWFQQAFGGDKRGGPLVMGAPTKVEQFGFNPQQMNMSEARDIAEERVCACLGVPAAVVGFGAGLQQTQVGATMTELRKLAWHNGVLPLGRSLADELKRSLLIDFGDMTGLELFWDTDDVLALQEDEDKQTDRWNKMLASGAITLFEYRQGIGLEADDSHRIYLRPIAQIEVPEGAAGRQTVDPALPAPKQLGNKARASQAGYARGLAWARLLERQQRGLSAAFETPLKLRFASWATEARAAALKALPNHPEILAVEPPKDAKDAKAEPDAAPNTAYAALIEEIMALLETDQWREALSQAYGAHYLEVAKAVQDAAERAGLGTSLPDPVARAIVATGGRRVGLIDLDAQTRAAVFDALAEGRAEGEGVAALANRIADHVEAGPWREAKVRATIIARTETKYAQNISTIERARAAGVASFIVFDGRLGLPRSGIDHIARDGSIVTESEAIALADAEHPNGTLSFAPNFEE